MQPSPTWSTGRLQRYWRKHCPTVCRRCGVLAWAVVIDGLGPTWYCRLCQGQCLYHALPTKRYPRFIAGWFYPEPRLLLTEGRV